MPAKLLTRSMYSLLFSVVIAMPLLGSWGPLTSKAQSLPTGEPQAATGHSNQKESSQVRERQSDRRDDPNDPMLKTGVSLSDDPTDQAPVDLSAGNWTNIYPWTNVVSAVSATDVWLGGEYGHLARYTNGTWTALDPLPLRGGNIDDLNMLSSNSGWVISGGRPFYYDGSDWIERSDGLTNFHLVRLSAISANDVWAGGNSDVNSDSLVHWDGTVWTVVPLPDVTYCYPNDCDISFLNSAEGWASFSENLYHYLNGTWTPVPILQNEILDFIMALPGELWATAFNSILRYDVASATWTNWPTPVTEQLSDIYMAASNQGWAVTSKSVLGWDGTNWTAEYQGDNLLGISGVGDQVWAAGSGGIILHRLSSTLWEKQRGGPTSNHINGVVMTDTDNGWAVARATIGYDRILLRYTAGAWDVYTTTLATNTLNAIQMLSPDEGYAVGNSLIARWDGSDWTSMPISGPATMFYGVHMLSAQEGWAVGTSGRIFHLSGGQWTQQPTPPAARDLRTVHMDSSEHGWAAGGFFGTSVLFEYTGGNWVDRVNTLPDSSLYIRDLLFNPGGSEGWAVGWATDEGTAAILHYLDGNWSSESGIGQAGYTSIAPEALGELWAVSCDAEHRVGTTWQQVTLPNRWCLYGVSLTLGRGGWAVGPFGTILQYNPLAAGQRYYDVPTDNTFYSYIECMATRGIISGYADNTFRPNNNITRGQLSKIVSNSAGFNDPPGTQIFEDVPPGSPFYDWIQRLASRGFIGGYPCGGQGEPCGPGNRPYFRPDNDTTRAQITKIISNTAGYGDPAGAQIFEDVPPAHGFYQWVQRLASRGIMGGYPCGGAGEPCGPDNLPYFHPNNGATRGQVSKIVTNTFFPNCQNP